MNVLTDYASRPAGVIAPEASMHGLQQKAGSWMDDFISAIKNPDFSFDSFSGISAFAQAPFPLKLKCNFLI